MKALTGILSVLLFSVSLAQAEITPVNIVLHDGNTRYSVPAGKVLIIEHFIWALESDSTSQTISINPASRPSGVGSILLRFPSDAPDSYAPPRPIRLVGGPGASVSILFSGGANWRDVMVVGLLVDPEDLYAKMIPTDLKDSRIVGGRLMAEAKFASARPRRTKVLSSTNLEMLSEDSGGTVNQTLDPSKAMVSVATEGSRKFMAVEARAIPSE